VRPFLLAALAAALLPSVPAAQVASGADTLVLPPPPVAAPRPVPPLAAVPYPPERTLAGQIAAASQQIPPTSPAPPQGRGVPPGTAR